MDGWAYSFFSVHCTLLIKKVLFTVFPPKRYDGIFKDRWILLTRSCLPAATLAQQEAMSKLNTKCQEISRLPSKHTMMFYSESSVLNVLHVLVYLSYRVFNLSFQWDWPSWIRLKSPELAGRVLSFWGRPWSFLRWIYSCYLELKE